VHPHPSTPCPWPHPSICDTAPPLPSAAPVLCTCPGPLFKCYLTLAQKCHDCHCCVSVCVGVYPCVCAGAWVFVWAWQTHKMPHSCCKICGHPSLQSPPHHTSTPPRLKWIRNPKKEKYMEFHAHLTKWFYRFWYLLICWSGLFVEFRINIASVVAAVFAIYEAVSFGFPDPNSTLRYPGLYFCSVRTQSCKAVFCVCVGKMLLLDLIC